MIAPDIFYVEDNEDFSFIMQQAVKAINANLKLTIEINGKAALVTLDHFKENKIKPGLILLDLNLPGLSGIDILKKVKEIPFFDDVAVVFFSTSDHPQDISSALEFGAAEFITKPSGYIDLLTCVRSLYEKWFLNIAK